jgi:predicted O-methyltransferase YrrM
MKEVEAKPKFHENWYCDNQIRELSRLLQKTKQLSGNIIEVGCWEGKSTSYIARSCYPEIVICNDTWLGNVSESLCTGKTHVTELILKERDVYKCFIKNMNSLTKGNYEVVKKDCLEWLKSYNEPIKFIHIDASHEFENVYKTIKLVLPKIVKGGIICGDDFQAAHINRNDLQGGVERAVRTTLPNFKSIGNLWYWCNK